MRRQVGSWLEDGRLGRSGLGLGLAERVGAAIVDRARASRADVPVPCGVAAVVAVGGATLGGAGKTPLALAVARALAAEGPVVFVGHAHRARPGGPRRVLPGDALEAVGDEALVAARALADLGPRAAVCVAPHWSAALAASAARDGEEPVAVVVDGGWRIARGPRSLRVLALDARRPWGAGARPPRGDLHGSREALVAAADVVARVGSSEPDGEALELTRTLVLPPLPRREDGAPPRVGLVTALAHPERLLQALARRGVRPVGHLRAADHGPVPPRELAALARATDVVLATAKCALHVEVASAALRGRPGGASRLLGPRATPVCLVEETLELSPELRARLAAFLRAARTPHAARRPPVGAPPPAHVGRCAP